MIYRHCFKALLEIRH